MAPLVRKNPALFMPHVRSSSRAPPSFCVMNPAAPCPLRVPSVNYPLVFGMKKASSVTRRAVQCRSSRRLHRGAPHPTANLFFPPSLSLPLSPLGFYPPPHCSLITYPPLRLLPPPSRSSTLPIRLNRYRRGRERERAREREECG